MPRQALSDPALLNPFAGIIRVRFRGFGLSPYQGHPVELPQFYHGSDVVEMRRKCRGMVKKCT